jgi:hypothetical protein
MRKMRTKLKTVNLFNQKIKLKTFPWAKLLQKFDNCGKHQKNIIYPEEDNKIIVETSILM